MSVSGVSPTVMPVSFQSPHEAVVDPRVIFPTEPPPMERTPPSYLQDAAPAPVSHSPVAT